MFNKKRFNRIARDIKSVKIQGATNVAKAALRAYSLKPTKSAKNKLLKLRPTEPMLAHVLELADKLPKKQILKHFKDAQTKINRQVFMLIKNGSVIFTHCHSTNVIKALIYAKKHGKKFEVYNTETRPLYQGRKTSKQLRKAKIKVTQFVDAAANVALQRAQETRKVSMVLLGADALLKDAVINKVGSGIISQLAEEHEIPLYIIADSWKYSPSYVKLEQRHFKEVWGTKDVHIKNPAFEPIPKEHITKIITELGTQTYASFLRKVKTRKY
jgi:translation initiation factor 2B subunit (eIF-2B alpha/beta/delta family)